MDELSEWIHDNRYALDAEGARKFLNRHALQIDWDEFEEWAAEVWDQSGYGWLQEVFNESSDDERFMLEWKHFKMLER